MIPILFWIEIYNGSTTQYDENWGHFFLAVILSFINAGLLVYIRNDFSNRATGKRAIRIYSIILATPLTICLIVIYLQTIPMSFVWSSAHTKGPNGGETYSEEKRRNYFKAENLLILENLYPEADTIKALVKRNGELEGLICLQNGKELKMEFSELDKLTEKQREKLIEYENAA